MKGVEDVLAREIYDAGDQNLFRNEFVDEGGEGVYNMHAPRYNMPIQYANNKNYHPNQDPVHPRSQS